MGTRPVSVVGKVLFMLIIFMVTSSNGKPNGSPCQLRKSCTLLENMQDQDFDLDSKKRICYLATKALLIPDDDDCEKPASGTVDTIDSSEDLPETLCQLRQSCALMALMVTPPDPHYETMKDVCQLAQKKMDVNGDIACEPVGMTGKGNQDGSDDGINGEHASDPEGQSERPELSRAYYFDDCSEVYAAQTMFGSVSSGVYTIKPVDFDDFEVYCDMGTDGGGWTVIQNRFDGTLHFNRRFSDYKYGFGSANGEHWLGLENMYRITAQNTYELYVELEDWSNNTRYAKYSSFRVGVGDHYELSLGSFSGNAGDRLEYNNGMKFSTGDRDQDASSINCAAYYGGGGGWWYKSCGAGLNGPYLRPSDRTSNSGYGIFWNTFSPSTYKD
ncbi:ANGPTL1 [Branchiostoma lanceolatum]|uniref:ANGPTL1 protein n=1 Tax=Branchiostoma lanceolatum TaxID=7740 RepID=A0A8J9VXU5_BRALA|nr:ANGPTL1 [Branchiostoma lanceolatum]